MKKLMLCAVLAGALTADALPTYEPFTEYSGAVAATGTNAVDFTTGNFYVTNGAVVEQWGALDFYGTATARSATNDGALNVVITNNVNTVFTGITLAGLLPAGFPGTGGSIQLTAYIPTNGPNTTLVGNSPILKFSQDVLRPATGSSNKTLYVSYLLDVTAIGQTGTGNVGRYSGYLADTNLIEPPASGPYQTWSSFFNTFLSNSPAAPDYVAYGLESTYAGNTGDYLLASDSYSGPAGSSRLAGLGTIYNTASFMVGEFIFTTNAQDTNIVWVNPATTNFGGPVPPTNNMGVYPMHVAMSDLGGFFLLSRPGESQAGGTGPIYVGNLLIGNTWSYVTGGPEFTNVPMNAVTNLGGTVTFQAAAVAAGQSVSYQWSHIISGVTNEVADGIGGAGGNADVTIITNGDGTSTLTLAGISSGDLGTYLAVVTASGTGFTLGTVATLTSDPLITSQPQTIGVALGEDATFNIGASTQFGALTYQWQVNGVNVSDGLQPDGSSFSGSTTSSFTIVDFQSDENDDVIICGVTNGIPDGELSNPVTVSVADPAITTQPVSATVNDGATTSFSGTIESTRPPINYGWYMGSIRLFNGLQSSGSFISGAAGSATSNLVTTTLTISNTSYFDQGTYFLVATNFRGKITSSTPVTLTVNDPYIATQPPSTIEVAVGGTASIPVTAYGTSATYQWNWTNANGAEANSGEIAGITSPTLTIAPVQAGDAGTYQVVVSGASGQMVTSSNTVIVVENPITALSVNPAQLTQQTNTHLAFVGNVTGGAPLVHLQWLLNGALLTNGPQVDGSYVSGVTSNILIVSNVQSVDSGNYTLTASNAAGVLTATGVLNVSTNLLPLSTNNLEIIRIGDGAEPLSPAGNTFYLDQYTTNGSYVSTIMIPDAGASRLLVPGAGSDYQNESCLTVSSNQLFLNFGGYCESYPFSLSGDITIGGAAYVRGIGSVDAFGYYALAYTNYGLYNAGSHFFRSVYSTDGVENFWMTGAASSADIKYVNITNTTYANGSGVPALGYATATANARCIGLINGNISYTDSGDTNSSGSLTGLDAFNGAPEPVTNVPVIPSSVILSTPTGPNDFAVSPDGTTLYIADDRAPTSSNTQGGIDRYDTNTSSGGWTFSYSMPPLAGGTNGAKSLAVYFPPAVTNYGAGVTGAVIYATTVSAITNSIVQITDNGIGSSGVVLLTAGTNEFYRGIRFGPAASVPTIGSGPSRQTSVAVGGSATFTVYAGGGPLTYQWQLNGADVTNGVTGTGATISGAQTGTLTISNIAASDNNDSFTLRITNPAGSITTAPALLLTLPTITTVTATNLIVANGGTAVITVNVTGSTPITYQWTGPCGVLMDGPDTCNGSSATISGSSTASLTLSNVTSEDDGSYYVTITNINGAITNNSAGPTVLVVSTGTSPAAAQFSTNAPLTGFDTGSPKLNFSGPAGTTYHIYGTTDLTLTPVVTTWTLIGTGTFSGGMDSFPISATNGANFYEITEP